MRKRIFAGFFVFIVVFGAAVALLSFAIVNSVSQEHLANRLQDEADVIQKRIQQEGADETLKDIVTTSRVTYIKPDGEVIFDSWTSDNLENHFDRPEVQEALKGGTGYSLRYSVTTQSNAIYVTRLLEDGNILRVAAPERLSRGIAREVMPWLAFSMLLLILLSIPLAGTLTRKLVKPILSINLDHPEDAVVYDEVLPLVKRINAQNHITRAQMEALDARRQELDTLLSGMHEGVVALDSQQQIILINLAASAMLGTSQEEARGKLMAEVNRSPVMLEMLDTLRKTGNAMGQLEREGRTYLLSASQLENRKGAVLLLSDQTDKLQGEAMRKRFTANVSHELRTPLTTICGYAELLNNNMVKQEDLGRFYSLIYKESSRMLTLVEDIFRLSRLDEGFQNGQRQRINLLQIAQGVCQSLQPMAEDKQVQLTCQGQDSYVSGDATLLDELCRNLVDNAIKYNVENGKVTVSVTGGSQAVLKVSDTGIGIEPEHQTRVFERFYRTDKSRSKVTGGTGLGLSIVKHAAEYHRAKITLNSQPSQGTAVTVVFPPPLDEGV